MKNYSENPVYVSFEDNTAENQSFKIAAGVGEEVAISYIEIRDDKAREAFFVDTVYVNGTGEVEVQEVDFDI